jgi:hypothetical protein
VKQIISAVFAVIIVMLFLAILNASMIPRAFGGELSREQSMYLYAVAYGELGHIPATPPVVHMAPRVELCRIAGMRDSCAVLGLETNGQVYLDESLDFTNPLHASIALHEFVHYVQRDQRGDVTDCVEYMRREHQAYQIQIESLARIGADYTIPALAVRMLRCS